MGLTVHDIAYRYVQNRIVFDFIDTGTGGTEKYQVVYGGNELADAAFVPYDILVAHGDENSLYFPCRDSPSRTIRGCMLRGRHTSATGNPCGTTHRGVLQICLIIV